MYRGDHVYRIWRSPSRMPSQDGDPQTVGVGVMAYYGGNDDRGQAAEYTPPTCRQ